jgi:Fur family ferric uptake transcriptional regulator
MNVLSITKNSPDSSNDSSSNDSSSGEERVSFERQGPLRWEQSQKIFEIIQKKPEITAAQLQAEGAALGVEMSVRSAFRFLKRYRDSDGDIFKDNQTHLQIVANILRNSKAGTHLSPQAIKQIAAQSGRDLHMTTIYRILQRLLSAGTIVHLEKNKKSVYEWKRGEAHHGHLNCLICDSTIEFHQDYLDELAKFICNRFGHDLKRFDFTLFSYCPKCK